MRPIRRLKANLPQGTRTFLAFTLVSFVTACSLPDVKIDKQKRSQQGDNSAAYSTTKDFDRPLDRDKRYLATVQLRLTGSKDSTPFVFDVNRDRHRIIAARLWESEETLTTINIGYNSDGPVAGFRFNWRFY